ncbi:MAG: hypothetical protein AUI42_07795 [Actinobacteria bacterium 13_1_40CM_2_65_8]|nr:MAG: hypothetical protein AUI42_07795 [Actinobacteria bacterium 13_1_40CM_2_65_8]
MKDLQREIVNQVASGKISAEEGAARLESLEAVETSSQAGSVAAPAGVATKRVRVMSVIGAAEIVGDPSVTYAVAEGPHRARQDGDTMVIEQGPFDENDHFTFGADRRIAINSIDPGRRKLKVRMNPKLALSAQVNAGSLRIEGVHGPISGEVLAGSCRISDFEAPLDLSIQAGNLTASGRLDGGASKVRCEMGNVTINLEKGSSVKVTARTTMGKVAVDSGGAEPMFLGQSGKEVTVGTGEGSLDIDCTMGNVRVSA